MNKRKDIIIGMLFALIASIAYGANAVLVKKAVSFASPLAGAAISLLSGTVMLSALGIRRPEADLMHKKKAVGLLAVSGVLGGLGVLSNFFALSLAPVVVVSPLEAVNPLFALLWSRLFLSHLEKVTLRIVIGTILVIMGVIIITFARLS